MTDLSEARIKRKTNTLIKPRPNETLVFVSTLLSSHRIPLEPGADFVQRLPIGYCAQKKHLEGSSKCLKCLVELRGIEPLTS